MNILVLNCGSSSLKYRLIRMPQEVELISGEAQKVGVCSAEGGKIIHCAEGKTVVHQCQMPDHDAAFRSVRDLIVRSALIDRKYSVDVLAHRYVHPGHHFNSTVRIDESSMARLEKTLPLAPIHNPMTYSLIKSCSEQMPDVPQYVVFDTSFHRNMPPEHYTYALPRDIARRMHLRRIGFHGISHEFVMQEACSFLGRDASTQRIISCHLGTGGGSVCAIENGKSVYSSMGFTPLEGLVMNTRCGDVDPALLFYGMAVDSADHDRALMLLNKKSGTVSLAGFSADMREVLPKIGEDRRAAAAADLYVRRVKRYIGFYLLLLKKTDILIFTDTLGVESPYLRAQICKQMQWAGICINNAKNGAYDNGIADISTTGSQTRILVIPTNEECLIARETYRVAHRQRRCKSKEQV
jgi:acetate kinase